MLVPKQVQEPVHEGTAPRIADDLGADHDVTEGTG
jgi:hypothetical protein